MESVSPQLIKEELRKAGLRATASRVAVLMHMRAAKRPQTHATVVTELGQEQWDKATLYRNLMDLVDAGLLARIALGSSWHFEESAETHPHFVCMECGDVQCADGVDVSVTAKPEGPKAIQHGNVSVQLHGVCDACD